MKHYVIRIWPVLYGSASSHYVKFLDEATDRILLRMIGGG
jgi:hypothetical protein